MSELIKFRLINKTEGWSYLILLFIAMPLKYIGGFDIATKIAGSMHGALFVAFVYQLLKTKAAMRFSTKETARYFILSLLPFGSFYTEKLLTQTYQRSAYRDPLATETIRMNRRNG